MGLGEAIFSKLSNDAGVTAIAGSRIYPGVSPDNVYPLASYTFEADQDTALVKSISRRFVLTVSCVSLSYTVSQSLGNAIIASLDRQTWTTGAVIIQSCVLKNTDASDYSDSDNAERVYYSFDLEFGVVAAGTF